jgi:hypothetical protein
MNTDEIERMLEANVESLVEFLEGYAPDICVDGELSYENYARLVVKFAKPFMYDESKKVLEEEFFVKGSRYMLKIAKVYQGYVSVSSEYGVTGVSHTAFFPIYKDESEG